jgi:hypothetical protein
MKRILKTFTLILLIINIAKSSTLEKMPDNFTSHCKNVLESFFSKHKVQKHIYSSFNTKHSRKSYLIPSIYIGKWIEIFKLKSDSIGINYITNDLIIENILSFNNCKITKKFIPLNFKANNRFDDKQLQSLLNKNKKGAILFIPNQSSKTKGMINSLREKLKLKKIPLMIINRHNSKELFFRGINSNMISLIGYKDRNLWVKPYLLINNEENISILMKKFK